VKRGWVAAAACLLVLAACSNSDDASTATSGTIDAGPAATAVGGVTPQGFDTIGLTIRDATSSTHRFCMWLADTSDKRDVGLMKVTDLGGKSGMLFNFEKDTNSAFYMFQTVMPLSIAFFASDGSFVSSTDMVPCTSSNGDDCELYSATGTYRDAIEVPQGGLAALGIGPGSAIVDRGACPA